MNPAALALITHAHVGRPQPSGPSYLPFPYHAIRVLIDQCLGPRRCAGQAFASPPSDRSEDALARTRFGAPRRIFCAGGPDIVQDIADVLPNYFLTSFAARHLFSNQRERSEADVRAELVARSPSGRFWDWPGDTEILLASKSR